MATLGVLSAMSLIVLPVKNLYPPLYMLGDIGVHAAIYGAAS